MARETTKWPSTRWPITKIMSSDGCNGNRVPLEMGPWYDFREFGCHLGNVGSEGSSWANSPIQTQIIQLFFRRESPPLLPCWSWRVLVLALAAPAAAGDNRGSAEEAQDMVARAIAYYDEMGAEAAVARFNADPAPEFLDRDLYIFVIGPEGTVVAHGVDSSLLGVALASFIDADGKEFGEEIGLMASAEGAWVDYKWKNPVSVEIEQKSSWIVAHDGHIFGAGVYRP